MMKEIYSSLNRISDEDFIIPNYQNKYKIIIFEPIKQSFLKNYYHPYTHYKYKLFGKCLSKTDKYDTFKIVDFESYEVEIFEDTTAYYKKFITRNYDTPEHFMGKELILSKIQKNFYNGFIIEGMNKNIVITEKIEMNRYIPIIYPYNNLKDIIIARINIYKKELIEKAWSPYRFMDWCL